MKKKLLVLFIALIAVSLLVFSACNVSKEAVLEFTLNDDDESYSVIGVTGEAEHIVIPAEYNGKPVTRIGDKVFYYWDLESLSIPESITSIGKDAFGMSNITSVYITDIAKWCAIDFEDSFSSPITNIYLDKTLVTDLVIPPGVTSISNYAFCGNKALKSVTIGNDVTNIGKCSFEACYGITTVTIGEGVTQIGNEAFRACRKLENIIIADSVENIGFSVFDATKYYDSEANWENEVLYIGNHLIDVKETISGSVNVNKDIRTIADMAFVGCTNLSFINVSDDNLKYTSIDGNLYTKDETTLLQYAIGKTDTSFVIPDFVTHIAPVAFSCCTYLNDIIISNSVINIGFSAFLDCTELRSVCIPNSVTSIDFQAFYNCTGIRSINYRGTEEQWNAISKGYNWDAKTGNYTMTYNYTGE